MRLLSSSTLVMNCPLMACLLIGIWTDGAWVFSTGLDQRLRCWRLSDIATYCESSTAFRDTEDSIDKSLSSSPSLLECYLCVIDVPEAESLHVESVPIR